MTAKRKKIALVGAGNIGGELLNGIAREQLGDAVLFDIPAKLEVAKGKVLDTLQAAAVWGKPLNAEAASDYSALAGADLCIVTAGVPRKPGMSRDDLVATNVRIIRQVAAGIREHAPDSTVIVLSNPLDAMVSEMQARTGFPAQRVIGMAGVLDSARFSAFIADALKLNVKDIRTLVLGGHGDTMVPCLSYCTANGIPVPQLLPAEQLDAIVERTRRGGGEIVKLMGTSAYIAPAASALAMAAAVLRDEQRVLPCAAKLNGEYGVDGIYMGVPAVLGAAGIERVVEVELSASERDALTKSANAVRELVESAQRVE